MFASPQQAAPSTLPKQFCLQTLPSGNLDFAREPWTGTASYAFNLINPTFHELQHYLLIMGGNDGMWESGTPKINPPKKICFPFPYDIGTV